METKTKATNLFSAGTKVKDTTKKVSDKKIISAPGLESKIKRFAELKALIDAETAELKMIEGDIKTVGKELFLKEYRSNMATPDNFKISDATGAACMFICMDKYTVVDQVKADFLTGAYPGLVNEKTVFTLNAELVEKYGEVLSNLIMECEHIADEDKPNLITGELSYSVAKGSIDKLLMYDKANPENVFELINPICMLKK